MFYVNNYIDWYQLNQLYDLDQIENGIKNVNAVAHKLESNLTKATNYKSKVANKKRRKKEKMIKKQKTKAMAAKP